MAGPHADDLRGLARDIDRRSRLHGEFTLRSGATATQYFDKFQFESDPVLLRRIAGAMVPLIPAGTDVLAGLEMGGIPVVTALSAASGLPAVFVRKQAKAYGTQKFAEGPDVRDARVLVVEDVVTSGGQIVLSTQDLRGIGAVVTQAFCVIDRRAPGQRALEEAGIELVSLLTAADLGAAAMG
jgi:orotate phosphoribosyltransferase